jgi:hypothetical protein
MVPPPERKLIALRAFGRRLPLKKPRLSSHQPEPKPSEGSVTWDTEDFKDAHQQLRVGTYLVHQGDALHEAGIFYDPLSLSDAERSTVYRYAAGHNLEVRTAREFVEDIFFPIVYGRHGLCITLNGPFDLGRLAIGHGPAERPDSMRGGFSLQLGPDDRRPHVQIKHLNNRAALVQFTDPVGQKTPRGMRKRGMKVPVFRGHFVDVRSLAGALLSGSWDLKRLSNHMKVRHPKLAEPDFSAEIDEQFLDYAVRDPLTTWECFTALKARYDSFGLTLTPITRVLSEAGLAKACLRQLGIKPWREMQPDFPARLTGIIMSSYYGGRSEVKLRRMIRRILYCDFLSEYPTTRILMNLWPFVRAKRVTWRDAKAEVHSMMRRLRLSDLQQPDFWPDLCVLVQVLPKADIFPVRSEYDEHGQHTIGLNYLTSKKPMWFTLADCIVSWLLTGRWPKVRRAIRFEPEGVQEGLREWDIFGNPANRVNPICDDPDLRLIDLRTEVRDAAAKTKLVGDEARAAELDAEQQGMKITENAMYGILVELNVVQPAHPVDVEFFGVDGKPHRATMNQYEEPGTFFHPLLAALIAGAGRLFLGIAERLATDEGLEWAFCDTDSMALAQPVGMDDAEFLDRARRVRGWFTPLNPYKQQGPIFKIEDANYRLDRGNLSDELEPLFCFCVSPKRYDLFNIDARGRPVLRKASGHGLGHLRAPYDENEAPKSIPKPVIPLHEIGVRRWEYDFWHRIVEAAMVGHPGQVKLDDLPGFDKPAMSRYAATTPELLRWFKKYNRGRAYRDQVRPFGFICAFQATTDLNDGLIAAASDEAEPRKQRRTRRQSMLDAPRVVSPFDTDPAHAAERAFDRNTGKPIPVDKLLTYRQVLAQYHLHPDPKFAGADYLDSGVTERRHIEASGIQYIGKEANRWEEQFYLGENPEAQLVYANPAANAEPEISEQTFAEPAQIDEDAALLAAVRERCKAIGVREFASQVTMDHSNLEAILARRRSAGPRTISRLRAALGELR